MIPQRNLSLLSNRLARKGGHRIPERVLERDYCLAWFLVSLSKTPLRTALAFKGGTALKRCYFGDYRFSENLDFTLQSETTWEEIRRNLDPVLDEVRRVSAIVFEFLEKDRRSHENSHTFYLGYEGPLPASSGRRVKVDITIKERVVFSLEDRLVLRGYDEYEDLPDDRPISVYSLKEIATEKVVALIDPARNEPRDLYDIWFLESSGSVRVDDLLSAVEEKLDFRGKTLSDVKSVFHSKESRYKRLWEGRLSAQMRELPEFERVYREVQRAFRQAGLSEK
jgi:predicted nucleotidyltransferase component of viral defense system